MTYSEKVTKVAQILKQRIPVMTHSEAVDLAFQIVTALDEPKNN
jgi:hypothetical protein